MGRGGRTTVWRACRWIPEPAAPRPITRSPPISRPGRCRCVHHRWHGRSPGGACSTVGATPKAGIAVYNMKLEGSRRCRLGESGGLVHNVSVRPIPPSRATDCFPQIKKATATEFQLVNPSKQSNFIIGELVTGGQLSFIVENLPKTTPHTGCPGRWMFQQMMRHFGASVTAIQGNWVGTSNDNLIALNRLTAGDAMTIDEAANQTWTGMRARDYGYAQVKVVGAPVGTPGCYTSVHVHFTK